MTFHLRKDSGISEFCASGLGACCKQRVGEVSCRVHRVLLEHLNVYGVGYRWFAILSVGVNYMGVGPEHLRRSSGFRYSKTCSKFKYIEGPSKRNKDGQSF